MAAATRDCVARAEISGSTCASPWAEDNTAQRPRTGVSLSHAQSFASHTARVESCGVFTQIFDAAYSYSRRRESRPAGSPHYPLTPHDLAGTRPAGPRPGAPGAGPRSPAARPRPVGPGPSVPRAPPAPRGPGTQQTARTKKPRNCQLRPGPAAPRGGDWRCVAGPIRADRHDRRPRGRPSGTRDRPRSPWTRD